MVRYLLTGLAALLSAAGGAIAADIPAKGPIYKVAPIFNWSGSYIGIVGGYGTAETAWINGIGTLTTDFDVKGGFVGITLGRNWQNARWVYGLEADASWAGLKGNEVAVCGGVVGCRTEMEWIATFRGRIGYTITPTVLLYGTAGVSVAGFKNNQNNIVRNSDVDAGFTAGAGLEAMIAPRWSAKLEYLYSNAGDGMTVPVGAPPGRTTHFDTHLFRLGLNYKLGWWQ